MDTLCSLPLSLSRSPPLSLPLSHVLFERLDDDGAELRGGEGDADEERLERLRELLQRDVDDPGIVEIQQVVAAADNAVWKCRVEVQCENTAGNVSGFRVTSGMCQIHDCFASH